MHNVYVIIMDHLIIIYNVDPVDLE
jgi:hypothetical protein